MFFTRDIFFFYFFVKEFPSCVKNLKNLQLQWCQKIAFSANSDWMIMSCILSGFFFFEGYTKAKLTNKDPSKSTTM